MPDELPVKDGDTTWHAGSMALSVAYAMLCSVASCDHVPMKPALGCAPADGATGSFHVS